MKKIFELTIILLIILNSINLSAQHINYDDKGKIKIIAEDIRLNIIPIAKEIDNPKPENPKIALVGVGSTVLTALIPLAIDLVKSGIKTYNEREKLIYEGIYTSQSSGQGFYNSDYTRINLPKLELIRKVISIDDEKLNAVSLELIPELSLDQKAFRYKLGKINYSISKAKVKQKYNYIIPTIDIDFETYYLDLSEYKKTPKVTATLKIPPTQIGSTEDFTNENIYSGWITLPPKSTLKDAAGNPQSVDMSIYQITVTVNELNIYKSKAEDIAKSAEENQNASVNLLNELLNQALKEKPKD